MVEITILELNLNGEDLVANAPFSSGGWAGDVGEEDDEDTPGVADDGSKLKPVAVAAGLLALLALVVAVRRILGGEPEPRP